jgi:pyrroloquinoline quinone (PQQ) biosynthesis protein C
MESNRPIGATWRSLADESPLELLDPRSRLSRSKHARFVEKDGRITEIDLGGRKVQLTDGDSERVTALLEQLDQGRTLEETAAQLGWALDETLETVQELYLVAALCLVGDAPVPGLTFAKHLDFYVKSVQVRMSGSVPSLLEALERAPSRRLLLGALVETFHFVSSAASHLSAILSHATNDNLRMMWSEYLGGEFWHGLWLRQGLRAAGLSDEELDSADPLPGTLGVINCLRWAAQTDPLAYSACLAAGEQEGGPKSIERVSRYYDKLVSFGVLPEEVIRPFRMHALEDCGADHHSYALEAFAIAPPLTRQQQDQVRRAVLQFQRSVGEQLIQIIRYYGTGEGAAVHRAD